MSSTPRFQRNLRRLVWARRRRPAPPTARVTIERASQIERVGLKRGDWRDTYHFLMTVPMALLLALLTLTYLVANAGFALLYLSFPGSINHARPGSFADAYFFSVQTMATIGYGELLPQGLAGNMIATAETVFGMLTVALSAGIVFARVSRPTARVLFSDVAIITRRNAQPTLIFRLANRRRNLIVEAQITVTALRNEVTLEGERIRRFHELKLERQRHPIFVLSWTVLHVIDADSPLHGATPESLAADHVEIICSVTGVDETFSQPVHARFAYGPEHIRWNTRFADIMQRREDGRPYIDYTRFHDTIDEPRPAVVERDSDPPRATRSTL
jgi:inward rectifier potassium channel